MATVTQGQGCNEVGPYEVIQPVEYQPLPKVLGARDLTIFSLLTVVTLGSLSTVQSGGPATLLYWLLALVFFVGPRIIITHWHNKHFVGNETPYHWAVSDRGRTNGFFAGFCLWWPGVLIVVSAIEAYTELVRFFATPSLWSMSSLLQQGLLVISVLLSAMLIACIPMKWLKYVLMGIAIPYLCVFLFLGGTGIWWLASGHTSAYVFTSWHLNNNTTNNYGLAILSLSSVHIPLFFYKELNSSTGTRTITFSRFLWCSGILACGILFLGTLGVMVIVPSAQATTLTAPVLALSIVFGPSAGLLAANVLALGQIAIIATALLLYSRVLVVLAQEKSLPQQLARTNRYGVPVLSIVIQSLIASVLSVLFFVVAPYLISQISEPVKRVLNIDNTIHISIYHSIQLAALILITISSSLMFVSTFLLLRKSRRKDDTPLKERIYLFSVAFIGLGASMFGVWAVFAHSQFPAHISDGVWAILLFFVVAFSLGLGWFVTSLPRVQASLQEQRRLYDEEANLRSQLQESCVQQQVLLEEVELLYHEHAQAAVTDAVTGLPNHRAVMSKIDDMLADCRRTQQSCAILFTDLDHFKRVNDTWGHRAGDAILCEVGRRFKTTLRTQDFVGRYGGEEFAILLTGTDIEEASQIAERLRVAVNAEPCIWQEDGQAPLPIPVTTSIGVAVYKLHGITREALITSADQAMYRAKRTGRNRICIADLEQDNAMEAKPSDSRICEVEAVQALTAAASAHDGGTYDHAHRMVQLAEETARRLGRSEDEVHLIRLAALLHDIGKIGIPDAILHKPGPLTNDEWVIMRSHPDIGRAILEQTGGIARLLSNIVGAHHERWDGAGYPARLVGENIPLGARILSVADSYDAMTSRRAYREPLSLDQAKTELQRCAGSQFDPQVVDAFLRVLEEQKSLSLVDAV